MQVEQMKMITTGVDEITGHSVAFDIRDIKSGNGGVIPLHFYAGDTLVTGTIQAVNALEAADYADASTLWADIEGSDLSLYDPMGCTCLYAPYTHIRLNVTAGSIKCRVRH